MIDSKTLLDFQAKIRQRILYSHIKPEEEGMLPPDYLALHFPRFDRAGWLQAIAAGLVRINSETALPDQPLHRHDCVAYYPQEEPEPEAELHFRCCYLDDDIAVLEKPGNLCIHPTGPFYRHTLWALAGAQLGELHFISRLDRETSGLVLAARSRKMAAQMDPRHFSIRKEYTAWVLGEFPQSLRAKGWMIPNPDKTSRKQLFVPEDDPMPEGGSWADTEFYRESLLPDGMSAVRAILHTGRKHQIRATLSSLGYPLAGDKLYGTEESLFAKIKAQSLTDADYARLRLRRQGLHAALLEFRHPRRGFLIRCESEAHFR